jgi:geranylgeranyl diphosphate synthase type II
MLDVTARGLEAELVAQLDAAQDRARPAGPAAVALWDAVRDATRGGKRTRPRLLLETYAALAGTSYAGTSYAGTSYAGTSDAGADGALRLAVVFELLHTAFCLHDDVIDHDQVRHGRPNVVARYADAARSRGADDLVADGAGAGAALLAGDLVLALAFRLAASAPVDEGTRLAVLDLLDDVVQRSAAGELDDVLAAVDRRSVSLADVALTAAHKTAAYSVVGPVVAGAILAGAPAELLRVLGNAARAAGIAFQMTDDLLGTFGDEATTGKGTRRDLAEGKVTALVVLARATLAWPTVAAHLGDPDVSEPEAARVRAAIEAAGVRADAEDLAALYARSAAEALDDPVVPSALRELLTRRFTAWVGRDR